MGFVLTFCQGLFHPCSLELLASSFLFCSVSCFGVRIMLASQNESARFPSSSSFWNSLRKIVINSSLWHYFKFIYFERDRDSMSGKGQRQKERERIPSRLCTGSSNLWSPMMITWAETNNQTLIDAQPSHPGIPVNCFLNVW